MIHCLRLHSPTLKFGSVGLTEAEAIKAGYNVGVGKNYYSSTAKGYAMGINPGDVNDGFVKIVVDKKY